jgi:hypothetical protein
VAKCGGSAEAIRGQEIEKEHPRDLLANVKPRLLAGTKPAKQKPLLDLNENPQAGPANPPQLSRRLSTAETLEPPKPFQTTSPEAPSVRPLPNGTPLRPRQTRGEIFGSPTQIHPQRPSQEGKVGSKPTGTTASVGERNIEGETQTTARLLEKTCKRKERPPAPAAGPLCDELDLFLGGKCRKLQNLGAIYQETQPCEDQWANVCRTFSCPRFWKPSG